MGIYRSSLLGWLTSQKRNSPLSCGGQYKPGRIGLWEPSTARGLWEVSFYIKIVTQCAFRAPHHPNSLRWAWFPKTQSFPRISKSKVVLYSRDGEAAGNLGVAPSRDFQLIFFFFFWSSSHLTFHSWCLSWFGLFCNGNQLSSYRPFPITLSGIKFLIFFLLCQVRYHLSICFPFCKIVLTSLSPLTPPLFSWTFWLFTISIYLFLFQSSFMFHWNKCFIFRCLILAGHMPT